MSRPVQENITCPKCGKEGPFTMWSSLNTSLDPEKKDDLLSGKLFLFTCPECGNATRVTYPMLYHDMEKHIMIQLGQPGGEEEFRSFFNQVKDTPNDNINKLLEKMQESMSDIYILRYVHEINELLDKVQVLDAGFDDRIIEVQKLFLQAHLSDNNNDIEFDSIYFQQTEDGFDYVLVGEKGYAGSIRFNEESYRDIKEAFSSKLPDLTDNEDVVIDQKWAFKLIKSDAE